MDHGIRIVAACSFFVIGLSHVLQSRAWGEFFAQLTRKGRTGSFVNGFLTLPLGALIVAFHPIWTGIPAVLTVIGWLYLVKSLIYFCFPDVGLASMSRVSPDNARGFVWAGAGLLVVSALLGYTIATR